MDNPRPRRIFCYGLPKWGGSHEAMGAAGRVVDEFRVAQASISLSLLVRRYRATYDV